MNGTRIRAAGGERQQNVNSNPRNRTLDCKSLFRMTPVILASLHQPSPGSDSRYLKEAANPVLLRWSVARSASWV